MILISKILFSTAILFFSIETFAQTDSRKSYLEDIFIWKMTDELKLSIPEEKKFGEIQKNLNKRKLDLNKSIQNSIATLADLKNKSAFQINAKLNQHRELLKKYNHVALEEFEAMLKILGPIKFVEYLRIKNDLTNKMKSLLAGEDEKKNLKEEKSFSVLPPPKVIIEN